MNVENPQQGGDQGDGGINKSTLLSLNPKDIDIDSEKINMCLLWD